MNKPTSIVFSWIEIENGRPVKKTRALDVDYFFHGGYTLQDTSMGRKILTCLKKHASPNIWFSATDAYYINFPEKETQ